MADFDRGLCIRTERTVLSELFRRRKCRKLVFTEFQQKNQIKLNYSVVPTEDQNTKSFFQNNLRRV